MPTVPTALITPFPCHKRTVCVTEHWIQKARRRPCNFNTDYIKTGIFEIEYAKIAKSAFSVRTYSDYSDFYIVSKQDTEEQYENAVKFVQRIREYVAEQIN